MKVAITGSTGMVGGEILNLCLQSCEIKNIISFVRKPTSNKTQDKLSSIVVSDFEDYSEYAEELKNVDMAFFCIGVYTGKVKDDLFKKITVNYAVEFAKALKKNSPKATLCLLSGAGADRSEKSRTSFARYKGMAENQVAELGLNFYSFRPGYIYPVEPRKEPNLMYRISRSLYPLIRLFGKNTSIKSTELAQAMLNVGRNGASKEMLENRDILTYV